LEQAGLVEQGGGVWGDNCKNITVRVGAIIARILQGYPARFLSRDLSRNRIRVSQRNIDFNVPDQVPNMSVASVPLELQSLLRYEAT
jgi:hypothetical protein